MALAAALATLLQATAFAALLGLLLVFGSACALFDVAINAEGSVLEAASGKKVILREEAGAVPALAALGFASFSAAMAATRFAGDRLRTHISAPRLLAASGLLAAVAMALVLPVRDPVVALIGLAVVGAGLANVVPILFIAATKVPGVAPAPAIAAVSSIGYLGMVAARSLVTNGGALPCCQAWAKAAARAASRPTTAASRVPGMPRKAPAKRRAILPGPTTAQPNSGLRSCIVAGLFILLFTEEAAALVRPEARVDAARGQQAGVGAFLDDAAMVHHNQPVHRGDRR